MEEAKEVLGEEVAANGQGFCGYGGFAITYPVEHGRLFNMFAVRRGPVSLADSTTWVMPCSREEMLQDFVGWHPGLVELLTRFENTNKWALFDLAHDEKYYRGRICLMGDSAHATTPNLGAGMGIAMEDAYILGNLLAAAKDPADIESALEAYDTVRRPRTQRLIRESRRAGLTNELLTEGIEDDTEKWIKDRDNLYRWLWNFDLEAQLKEAKQLMK
jgi:salicylate hydroxylase